MNILVCVKQVPDTNEIKINPVTNTLIRDGVPSILNTFDAYAMEGAARLKDQNPDTRIIVVTMGPPQAESALRDCLAIAADKAYLATDRAFGGSDTLATSYILSCVAKKIEELEGIKFDAIFCGKQAIDGDTAQVGPELAEHLGYPQVTYAWDVKAEEGGLCILREAEDDKQLIGVKTPCVVTFTKPDHEVRYPTLRRKIDSIRAEITSVTAMEMPDMDLGSAGLKGSPTKVKKTFVPQRNKETVMIKAVTADEKANQLYAALCEAHVL